MTVAHDFYRDPDGRWYIDLPPSEVSKPDCQMVEGADTMLDVVSEGRQRINALICDCRLDGPGWTSMRILRLEEFGGATYAAKLPTGTSITVWLCPVTLYVFGGQYPDDISFSVSPE